MFSHFSLDLIQIKSLKKRDAVIILNQPIPIVYGHTSLVYDH